MSDSGIPSVLFVCLGNICRSPAAEGVALHLLGDEGDVLIDSAGTSAYHVGEPADRRMRQAAARRGMDLPSRARQVQADDHRRFDLIVAMDRSNLTDLQRNRPADGTASLVLLSAFLGDHHPDDVPDPYYGGDDGFETVLDMLEEAMPLVLDEVRSRHGGSDPAAPGA